MFCKKFNTYEELKRDFGKDVFDCNDACAQCEDYKYSNGLVLCQKLEEGEFKNENN